MRRFGSRIAKVEQALSYDMTKGRCQYCRGIDWETGSGLCAPKVLMARDHDNYKREGHHDLMCVCGLFYHGDIEPAENGWLRITHAAKGGWEFL